MIINNQQTYILNFQTFVPLSSDVNCKEIIDALKTCDETATVRTNDLGVSPYQVSFSSFSQEFIVN